MAFDYFYGGESEQFSFYRIPRQLIVGPEFRHVSTDAKLLYGLMLDRMGLSARNGWYDEENRVFIYYPLDEIREALNCGNDKAVKLLAELDTGKGIGLIQRVKQGQGKPARIYVKRFTTSEKPSGEDIQPSPPSRLPKSGNPDFGKTEVKSSENQKSRLRESRSAEFGKSECIYTDKSYTELNQTNPSIHSTAKGPPYFIIDEISAHGFAFAPKGAAKGRKYCIFEILQIGPNRRQIGNVILWGSSLRDIHPREWGFDMEKIRAVTQKPKTKNGPDR